jgi:hypothetical protein
MDDSQYLLTLISDKTKTAVELGNFRGLDGNRAVVDVGGGRIPAEFATAYLPEVNDAVQVLFIDGKPYLLGSALPKPGEGEVVSVEGNIAVLSTEVGEVRSPYPAGLLVVPGDVVKLMWSDGPFVLDVMSTSPPRPTPPGPPSEGGQDRNETFTALGSSGSWQINGSRWSSDQPRASDGYLGAWFYGSKIADTIPAGAVLKSIDVYFRYASKFGSPPNVGLHSQTDRGGAPDVTDQFGWAVSDGWNAVPADKRDLFFNGLKAGGGKRGIGLRHGGVNRFASVGEDALSGAIRISWIS